MTIQIKGMPTEEARDLQNGGLDANGQMPEIQISDGKGNPCRHCLEMIAEGEELLVFSYKPFSSIQPYAEQGPVFLHKRECEAYKDNDAEPGAFNNKEVIMIRGYGDDERIVYGTGKIISKTDIKSYASSLFEDPTIRFIHLRSASNNCYQARIDNF